jgi:hypothetical protein
MESNRISSRKVNKKNRAKTRGKKSSGTKSGDSGQFGPDGRMVIFRMNQRSQTVSRVFMLPHFISTLGTGFVPITSYGVADLINTGLGTEFTNFAQEFQQYRVMSFKAHILPSTTSATSTTGPYQSSLICVPYIQLPLVNLTSLQQGAQKEIWSSLQETKVYMRAFKNALLWNEFNIAYPADRDFGFTIASAGLGAMAVSSRICDVLLEAVVQFRGAQ